MTSHISRCKFIAPALLLPLVAAVPGGLAAALPRKPGAGTLVAYFSRTGDTRVLAKQISRAHQATLFEIEPARPYPDDYNQTVEQARRERDSGFRPALKATVPDIDAYDALFLESNSRARQPMAQCLGQIAPTRHQYRRTSFEIPHVPRLQR